MFGNKISRYMYNQFNIQTTLLERERETADTGSGSTSTRISVQRDDQIYEGRWGYAET